MLIPQAMRLIKSIVIPTVFLLMFLPSCSVLEQAKEYERFINCKFSFYAIDVKEIAGISIEEFDNPEDLGLGQMMTITQMLFSGRLPAKIEITLKAENNAGEKAAIAGLDWMAMLKEEELLSGYVEHAVEVPANASVTFPVITDIDLMRLLQSESFQDIGAFVFGDKKKEELRKLGASLKIKPYYKVGSTIKKYPGYITIMP
jgi:hypothetical protein